MTYVLIMIFTLTTGHYKGREMERKIRTFGGQFACDSYRDIRRDFTRTKFKHGTVEYECRQTSPAA